MNITEQFDPFTYDPYTGQVSWNGIWLGGIHEGPDGMWEFTPVGPRMGPLELEAVAKQLRTNNLKSYNDRLESALEQKYWDDRSRAVDEADEDEGGM